MNRDIEGNVVIKGHDRSCPHRFTHGDQPDRSGVAVVIYDAESLNPLTIDHGRCRIEPTAKLSYAVRQREIKPIPTTHYGNFKPSYCGAPLRLSSIDC